MFHVVANTWWKSVKEPYQTISHTNAWTEFKKEFTEKFIPEHITDQKHVEFKQLKQEGMLVAEYIHQFTRLSRFAEDLVDTEEKTEILQRSPAWYSQRRYLCYQAPGNARGHH